MLAVDAGVHLASIIKIFEVHLPRAKRKSVTTPASSAPPVNGDLVHSLPEATQPKLSLTTGPFAGLELPFESAKANATYVFRSLISTYLITHPHLDHIAGFAINTAALQQTLRRKRVAALPSTIDALKEHIFNGIVWPNLSDEGEGAVGFVSYDRLVDGGNVALGDGDGRGYIEVCDGLAVKGWSVSHGECMKRHNHQGSYSSESTDGSFPQYYSRRSSRKDPPTPMDLNRNQNYLQAPEKKAYDSAAYFLRDEHTGKEILIFGDVEPDSVSLNPRTARVWQDAAAKIAAGLLTGILIECSYDNSQSDSMLFGHLTPRHLVIELSVLAKLVLDLNLNLNLNLSSAPGSPRKRKRPSNSNFALSGDNPNRQSASKSRTRRQTRSSISPSTRLSSDSLGRDWSEVRRQTSEEAELERIQEEKNGLSSRRRRPRRSPAGQVLGRKPLEGLQIIIIHIKDSLQDGAGIDETILKQLQHEEQEAQLGCTYTISKSGTSVWL